MLPERNSHEDEGREGDPMKYHIAKLFLATSLLASLFLATLLASSSPAAGQESTALSLEPRIPLPNVKGRLHHFSGAGKGARLFVSAVDNHTHEVVRLHAGHRVPPISELADPQDV